MPGQMGEPPMTADVILRSAKVLRRPTVSSLYNQGSAKRHMRSPQLLRELDNVAVRVTNV